MVVLSAAILTKAGKPLLARQFVELSRIRIEGLLAAFPKLIGGETKVEGKQHTYVETENVRYVYQPMEALYLLLITNRLSNIMEDLETLRLVAKLVPEYCGTLEEPSISDAAFDLIFAMDEVISLGYRENISLQQIRTNVEMESHEEKLHNMIRQSKIKDAKEEMKRKVEQIDKAKSERDKLTRKVGGPGASSAADNFGPSSAYREPEPPRIVEQAKAAAAATRPAAGKGMQLGGKAMGKTSELLQAMKAEGEIEEPERIVIDKVSKQPTVITEGIQVTVDEKLVIQMDRDGVLQNMEVKGDLSLRVTDSETALLKVHVRNGDTKNFQFKAHPNINKNLFTEENVLALKDPSRPFPTGSALGVLKWRYQTKDSSAVPLTINCWPTPSGGLTYVNIEYELTTNIVLNDVTVAIPIPGGDAPKVTQVDGDYKADGRNGRLLWRLDLIDQSNKTGAMEFNVPGNIDPSAFFPVVVNFSSNKTLCDLEVLSVVSATDNKPYRYANQTVLSVEEYVIS
mmetsp:Transcript_15791/g.27223  ORF Transcript_15791/g.27223 Transcript_15791/m.27223 type:complete len:513 (-) Transcript_15791:47-1585(-)|eukprot:CAMPEP_0196656712 /NCGR_PEP_ID=MMETSP1086-20130531/19393_1 /TAXON_ID=77921 /ORGANISM="Cyanoptyche  gloeocystis , Strain SAG4.97" /LENGTH=512 /DNA_ID=CAMNT_0041989563 /DNA_START=82 /DNA_END=1620 /DNA_ORIENTATION=+